MILEYQILDDQILAFLREEVGAAQVTALDAFDVARTVDDVIAEIVRVAANAYFAQVEKPATR